MNIRSNHLIAHLTAACVSLIVLAIVPAAAAADTLAEARACAEIAESQRRWDCYDRVFGQPRPAAVVRPRDVPAPAGKPSVLEEAEVVARPARTQAASEPVSGQVSEPVPQPEVSKSAMARLRPWDRTKQRQAANATRRATIVRAYPLARSRWLIRLDTDELFESNESDDFVPREGQSVEIEASRVSAGFTIRTDSGATRMKRLACDGSSRRREVQRKCELLLEDV